MLCRALIAAVAVTYLMCVLVLSGMQKEDLDVNMLTKLQRHNVNIDDMNNEELLEACSQSQGNNNNNKDANITKEFVNKTKNAELRRDFKSNAAFEVLENPRPAEYSIIENKNKKYDILPKKTTYEKLNFDKVIQYNDKQTQLGSILKLLEDTKINKVIKDQLLKPDFLKEQESKRSIAESIHSFETNDTLNRLFKNFVARRGNLSAKSTTSPKFEVIPEELRKDTEKPNILSQTNINDALTLINTLNKFKPYMDAELVKNHNRSTESFITRNPYQSNFQGIDTTTTHNVEPKVEITPDIIKEIAVNVKEIVLRDLRKELHKITTVTTTTTIMSTTTTQSTTKRVKYLESEIGTTLKKADANTPDSIMKKFLELFEEIKSMKQNTIIIKSDSEKRINNRDKSLLPHQMAKLKLKDFKIYPQTIKPNNWIQTKLHLNTNQVNRVNNNPPVYKENIYNFAPQLHRYKSNGTMPKITTTQQTDMPEQTTIIKHAPFIKSGLLPLTVQTNNIEILPLGIPIDNKENVIRQNIIITTKAPYRILPNKNQARGKQHLKAPITFKSYKSNNMHPDMPKALHRPPIHKSNVDDNVDIIRFTLSNNRHSKYNSDYYEKINLGKYRPYSDEIIQDTPRYHEKLEKIESYLDYPEENKYAVITDCCDEKFRNLKEMADCCDRRIIARQQMSLNNIKKKSYDDTHFKKFLHSQQKVTDMLEKILADKGNVHSVETV